MVKRLAQPGWFARIGWIAVPAVLAACSDYGYGDNVPQYLDSIPPPLADVQNSDRIVQVTTPLVDVLWTIDNSGSMFDEQDALAANFPVFINYFVGSGLDYHIGVTSTDIDNPGNGRSGQLRNVSGLTFIEPNTASPEVIFSSMARMGTNGSGTEKGLGATFTALELKKDTTNAGFYRDEASIHTVLISDERDQTQANLITQAEFVEWYDGLKPEADERSFSSIVTMSGIDKGTAYLNTTASIGGIVWDITDDDWSEVLERLGIQASGLKREYFLSQRPVAGTIDVHVEDVGGAELAFVEVAVDEYGAPVIPTGDDGDYYTYDSIRNSIKFVTYVPNALSTIVIDYTLLSAQQVEDQL
ncbi:MAG: hypothetical protein ABMB14_11320 [Myxococcota bacterium]